MSMTLSFRGESMGILPLDDIRRHPPVQHTPPQNLTNLHAPDRLANLGRLRLRLHRRLHRSCSRHAGRSTSSSSPNRRLRTRLLCNRPPNLLRRHRRYLLHLRLLRRNLGLLTRHQRNARAPRLPQIPLPLHGDRHCVVHFLFVGRLPLLRPVGGGTFARIRGLDD